MEENKIVCPQCGSDTDENKKFCTSCGFEMVKYRKMYEFNQKHRWQYITNAYFLIVLCYFVAALPVIAAGAFVGQMWFAIEALWAFECDIFCALYSVCLMIVVGFCSFMYAKKYLGIHSRSFIWIVFAVIIVLIPLPRFIVPFLGAIPVTLMFMIPELIKEK